VTGSCSRRTSARHRSNPDSTHLQGVSLDFSGTAPHHPSLSAGKLVALPHLEARVCEAEWLDPCAIPSRCGMTASSAAGRTRCADGSPPAPGRDWVQTTRSWVVDLPERLLRGTRLVLCVPKKREDLFRGRQESTTTTKQQSTARQRERTSAAVGPVHASHYRAWADFVDLAHTRFKLLA